MLLPGTIRSIVATPFVKPPSRPRKQMLLMPLRLASSSARRTFLDLPLVVKAMSTSPFSAEAPDLPRENFVRVIIVADGGHELAVGRERNGRIRPAVVHKAAEKFRGEMRGVRRAAAVAADEQLVAGSQAGAGPFAPRDSAVLPKPSIRGTSRRTRQSPFANVPCPQPKCWPLKEKAKCSIAWVWPAAAAKDSAFTLD